MAKKIEAPKSNHDAVPAKDALNWALSIGEQQTEEEVPAPVLTQGELVASVAFKLADQFSVHRGRFVVPLFKRIVKTAGNKAADKLAGDCIKRIEAELKRFSSDLAAAAKAK